MLSHHDAEAALLKAAKNAKNIRDNLSSLLIAPREQWIALIMKLWCDIDELRVKNEKQNGPADDAQLDCIEELLGLMKERQDAWVLLSAETLMRIEAKRLADAYATSIP